MRRGIEFYCYLSGAIITVILVLSILGFQNVLLNVEFLMAVIVILISNGILSSILNYVRPKSNMKAKNDKKLILIKIGVLGAFGIAVLSGAILGNGALPVVQDGEYMLIIRGVEDQIVTKAEFLQHRQAMMISLTSLGYFIIGNVILCLKGDCLFRRGQASE